MKRITSLWLTLLFALGLLGGCAQDVGVIGGADGPTDIIVSEEGGEQAAQGGSFHGRGSFQKKGQSPVWSHRRSRAKISPESASAVSTAAAVSRGRSSERNQLLNRCCSRYMLSCG